MEVRFVITAMPDPSKKQLIIRRIAQHPKVTIGQVSLLLEHLPAVILPRIDIEEAKSLAGALRAFGCQARFEPVPPEPVEQPPPEQKQSEPPVVPKIREELHPPQKKVGPMVFASPQRPEDPPAPQSVVSPIKKQTVIIIGVVVAVLLMILAQKFLTVSPSAPSKEMERKRRISRALKKSEQKLLKSPEDTASKKEVAAGYVKLSDIEKSTAKKIEYLDRAIKHRPKDRKIRRKLSHTLTDTAKRAINGESAIKFYQMALSFNKRNEAAWNGLISEYKKQGRIDEAKEALWEKERIFGKPKKELIKEILALGSIVDPPMLRRDTLFTGYQTKKSQAAVLSDLYGLAKKLSKKKEAGYGRFSVYLKRNLEMDITFPVRNLPMNKKIWESRVRIVYRRM